MNEDNQNPEHLSAKSTKSTVHTISIVLIVCMILSVLGVGLGIYSTIQANNALYKLSEEYSEEEPIETNEFLDVPEFSKPATVDDIKYVAITYNDGKDFADIVNDEEEGRYIEYYAYDKNDDYVGELVETDVNEILKYILENDLENCGEESFYEDVAWGFEISSTGGSCYASGDSGQQPGWFNAILKKINVDEKGYKSKAAE